MYLSHRAFVLIAMLTLAAGDIMEAVQADDTMPTTIDIVFKHRSVGKGEYESQPVRIDNFPVSNFYIRGDFGEKGDISPVRAFDWTLRRMSGVLPGNRMLHVGGQPVVNVKEGQLIPLCGHVYRFSRKEKMGLLTLLADHPLQFIPKDKTRYFSFQKRFKWGYDVDKDYTHGREGSGSFETVLLGENGRLTIINYTTISPSETAAVVSISCSDKNERHIKKSDALKYKLEVEESDHRYHILKVDDHIKTDEFDFVVRRIIPSDGKDNFGWIDLELLTGAKEAQDK